MLTAGMELSYQKDQAFSTSRKMGICYMGMGDVVEFDIDQAYGLHSELGTLGLNGICRRNSGIQCSHEFDIYTTA